MDYYQDKKVKMKKFFGVTGQLERINSNVDQFERTTTVKEVVAVATVCTSEA